MRYTLLAFLFLLPSCGVMRKIDAIAEKTDNALTFVNGAIEEGRKRWDGVQEQYAAVRESYGEMRALYTEHSKKADTDGDGETTPGEWAAYIGGPGGALLLAEWRRRKAQETAEARNARSDDRKAETEKKVESLEAQLAMMEKLALAQNPKQGGATT